MFLKSTSLLHTVGIFATVVATTVTTIFLGIRIMCRYGADTEDVYRLMTGLPGFPITITATYHHLKCFACLLLHGAKPDLTDLEHLDLPPYVTTQCSVPHAIIKYR